jgi:hypothetical protein
MTSIYFYFKSIYFPWDNKLAVGFHRSLSITIMGDIQRWVSIWIYIIELYLAEGLYIQQYLLQVGKKWVYMADMLLHPAPPRCQYVKKIR